jgi:hypothetical protein
MSPRHELSSLQICWPYAASILPLTSLGAIQADTGMKSSTGLDIQRCYGAIDDAALSMIAGMGENYGEVDAIR